MLDESIEDARKVAQQCLEAGVQFNPVLLLWVSGTQGVMPCGPMMTSRKSVEALKAIVRKAIEVPEVDMIVTCCEALHKPTKEEVVFCAVLVKGGEVAVHMAYDKDNQEIKAPVQYPMNADTSPLSQKAGQKHGGMWQ